MREASTKPARRSLFSVRRKEPGSGPSPVRQTASAVEAAQAPSSQAEELSAICSLPARHALEIPSVESDAPLALPPALHVRAGCVVRAGVPGGGAGEVAVAVGRLQLVHDRSSWEQLERYFAAAAEVAHRAPLLESNTRHRRAAMLLRTVYHHGALRPAWHMPEALVLSLVNASALLFTLQPQYAAVDIALSGGSLRLADPAVPHSEAPGLLTISLPALSVCRRAQSSGGSQVEVRFAAPLVFDTPVSGGSTLATRMEGAARDRPSLHAAAVLQEALAQHAQHTAADAFSGKSPSSCQPRAAAEPRAAAPLAAAQLAAAPHAAAASNASKETQARGAASASAEARHPSEREKAAKQPRAGWLHYFLSERCLRCCLPTKGTTYGLKEGCLPNGPVSLSV